MDNPFHFVRRKPFRKYTERLLQGEADRPLQDNHSITL